MDGEDEGGGGAGGGLELHAGCKLQEAEGCEGNIRGGGAGRMNDRGLFSFVVFEEERWVLRVACFRV